ncbi:pyridoxal phosphate-dependent aminotransferase [Sphingosinicella rhizophila]|uniref:histidinol-phosphate transaminase n=1 Tax=Sphingosinicella rhizophila TaxID=3050082 RepID=A0ABU3Q739_9SPHN|nr:histidinol-phosphate transaminase [Sphingosinicella sp. GR2756]MDT9598798.1 histidinol-phosphate transaminase [Sphingosinicella sp. GR2756]
MAPFDHGPSLDDARLASGRADILDLAGNENAVGASPHVVDAVTRCASEAWRYPDSNCGELGRMIAGRLGIEASRLVFGTGSEALLALIARATIEDGDRVILSSPTFPIYAMLGRSLGGEVIDVPRRADYRLDADAVIQALLRPAKLVFLCNPNNPTGTPVPREHLVAIGRGIGRTGLLIVDEAYHEFAAMEHPGDTLAALDESGADYFVLRTFSKAYALGGFRVGYAIARNPGLADYVHRVRPQFGVSNLAQIAAAAAWQDQEHLTAAVEEIREARTALHRGLVDLGHDVLPSSANFLMVADPDGALAKRLLGEGIIARRVPPDHIRLTVCRMKDVPRVIGAFARTGMD